MQCPPSLFLILQATAGSLGRESAAGMAQALDAPSPIPWVPILLMAAPALVAAVLLWLYAKTSRNLRRAQMAPPVWLLPYLEKPEAERPAWPPPNIDPDDVADQEFREESVAHLARRKRALLVALALNFVAAWAVAGVYLYEASRTVEFQEFTSSGDLTASLDTARFAGIEDLPEARTEEPIEAPAAAQAPDAPVDTAALRIRREQRQAFLRRQDSLAEVRRLDSVAIAAAEVQRIRDSVARAVRDSISRAAAITPAPRPTAPPPAPPPSPPPPDPVVERARAAEALRGSAQALLAAVNGGSVGGLIAPGGPRDRFLRFLEQSSPTATLLSVSDPSLGSDMGEGMVTLEFQWRGPFGDTRRRNGRFRADLVRGTGGWRVVSLHPLDNF